MSMTIDPRTAAKIIDQRKVKPIGTVAGTEYVEHSGQVYAIPRGRMVPGADRVDPDDLIVRRHTEEVIDGHPWQQEWYARAFPTSREAYEAALAKLARRRPAEPRPHVIDGLAFVWRQQDPYRLRLTAGGGDPTLGAAAARSGFKQAKPWVEIGQRPGAERSAANLVAWLEAKGVELSVGRDRLIVRSVKALDAETRSALEAAEQLIVGHLSGQPVACSLCDEAAVSVAAPTQAPLCGAHVDGNGVPPGKSR